MDYSNFIILLARQRSGTNALRSVFESHPDIYCHNEVFSFNDLASDDDPVIRDTNFFNFMKKHAHGDISRIYPDQHEKLFLDFLEYLRCFSSKRFIMIDVKYNTTHFFTEPYRWDLVPYLFYLIKIYRLKVLNITRKNYLRFVVSTVKAERTGVWALKSPDQQYVDTKVPVDIDYLSWQLNYCDAENRMIENYFGSYPHYCSAEYDEIFGNPSGVVSPGLLTRFADWMGLPATFKNESTYRKQSLLPLEETIENFDEVAGALRGTKYEYCLDDEMLYKQPERVSTRRPVKKCISAKRKNSK